MASSNAKTIVDFSRRGQNAKPQLNWTYLIQTTANENWTEAMLAKHGMRRIRGHPSWPMRNIQATAAGSLCGFFDLHDFFVTANQFLVCSVIFCRRFRR